MADENTTAQTAQADTTQTATAQTAQADTTQTATAQTDTKDSLLTQQTTAQVSAADARKYLEGLVADPDNLKAKSDEDVVKLAEQVKARLAPKPVTYTEFKVPEGVKIDEKVNSTFKDIVGKAGVSQETAQSLMDLYTAEMKSMAEAPQKVWSDLQTKWQGEVKADPEIGGANLNIMLSTVAKAIDSLGPEHAKAARDALSYTGAGNNPALVRLIYRLSKAATEGKPVEGGPTGDKGGKTAGEILYPNQGKQS